MSGYLVLLQRDGTTQATPYYWTLQRVIGQDRSGVLCKGSLADIALYLWKAYKRTQNGKEKRRKVNAYARKFTGYQEQTIEENKNAVSS